MTATTTPEQAMELAELIDAGEASAESANAMRSLAQQVEALTLENKNLLTANHHLIDAEQQAMDEVRSLTVERDALKVDAERYQWLREIENEGDHSIGEATDFCDGGWERVTWRYGAELDASIDAAMKAAS
jgi:predicted transglutaminase-like cysteine proteinase